MLKFNIEFQPRIIIDSQTAKETNCMLTGQGCNGKYDGPDVNPKDLVIQSIRETCMYQTFSWNEKEGWFDYAQDLIDNCLMDEMGLTRVTEKCHDEVAMPYSMFGGNKYNLDWDKYELCVTNQTMLVEHKSIDSIESLLERDNKLKKSIGSMFHPSITINNHTFRGDQSDPNVLFKALCGIIRNKPQECSIVNLFEKRTQDEKEIDTHVYNETSEIDMNLVK